MSGLVTSGTVQLEVLACSTGISLISSLGNGPSFSAFPGELMGYHIGFSKSVKT